MSSSCLEKVYKMTYATVSKKYRSNFETRDDNCGNLMPRRVEKPSSKESNTCTVGWFYM